MADEIVAVYRAEVEQYKKAVDELVGKVNKLDKEQGVASKSSEQMGAVMKKVGGVIAAAFTVDRIVAFGREAVKLAAQAEGVERAFRRIGSPQLLEGLRRATRGTVTDLQLMQNAVKASNFDIPLKNLASLFAFAQARARETGESVDYLVDSIILGIGRKSPLILDNLGISAVQLREKFKGLGAEQQTVGDVAQAVGEIADEAMSKMGEQADTAADSMARLETSTTNLQLALGKLISNEAAGFSKFLSGIADAMTEVITENENLRIELGSMSGLALLARLREEQAKLARMEADAVDLVGTSREAEAAKMLSLIERQRAAIQTIEEFLKAKRSEGDEYEITNEQIDRAVKAYNELKNAQNSEIVSLTSLNEELKALKEALEGAEVGSNAFFEAGEKVEAKAKEIEAALRSLRLAGIEDAGLTLLNPKGIDQVANVSLKLLNEQLAEAKKRREEAFEFTDEFNKAEADIARLESQIKNFNNSLIDTAKKTDAAIGDSVTGVVKTRKQALSEGIAEFQQYAQGVQSLVNGIVNASAQAYQWELQQLDYSLQQGQISREHYDQRRREMMEDNARQQRDLALFNAIINTAVAVTSALMQGPPQGYILAALSAALGAVEIATITAQPIPQFAEGVIGLQGAGTETSDSIPAFLSRGESVMTAAETKKYRPLLEGIRKGTLDRIIQDTYVRPAVDAALLNGFADIGTSAKLNASFNDMNLLRAIDRHRQSDKDGFKFLASELSKHMRTPKRGGYA